MNINLFQCDQIKLPLGNNNYLRPLLENDITLQYVDGLNDSEVNRFLTGPRQQRQTIDTVKHLVCLNRNATDGVLFGLFVDDTFRGTVRLHDINPEIAFLGLALFDKSIWGMGWGRRVIKAVTDFARNELKIKMVIAGIENENIASQKAFAAVGYKINKDKFKLLESDDAKFWLYDL